ncbi:MAG TPA: hypothetical protein VN494_02790, partial [Patescibacteria group bacterium]|nr:hypothetical protein [Patescibacteria group bacterium]
PGAVGLQLFLDKGEEVALLGMEQAVGPHLLEAAWQHMQKKPAAEPGRWASWDSGIPDSGDIILVLRYPFGRASDFSQT